MDPRHRLVAKFARPTIPLGPHRDVPAHPATVAIPPSGEGEWRGTAAARPLALRYGREEGRAGGEEREQGEGEDG